MNALPPVSIEAVGEHALLLSLPLPVTPDYPVYFQYLQDAVRGAFPSCREQIAGYRNLLLLFDGAPPAIARLEALLASLSPDWQAAGEEIVEIPVCYHPDLAPDLLPLAKSTGLGVDDVIALHSAPLYTVYCTGFIPGFPFLGEVDARIAAPRHGEPRREVAAGSVGIAGRQTGIYPKASPGGWQLVGRTPLVLYQPEAGLFSRFRVGMRVRFFPISLDDYHARTV